MEGERDLERIIQIVFSEKFPVEKMISLCVGTVVCKDFEKIKSSLYGCELCAVMRKYCENFKVPRVWMWFLHCGR